MRKKLLSVLFYFIMFFCFLLQCTLFKRLNFGGISPNLLIITTTSIGFMRGEKQGILAGFVSGLFIDIFFWRCDRALRSALHVHRFFEREIQQDLLSGGYKTSVGSDYAERPFLRDGLLYHTVFASRKAQFPLFFHPYYPA